tara:strand:- start:9044 stop:9532 length:489 start_codon:yes stop_codon:yes gene_type:complete
MKRNGFTLIELIVVIAVLATLAVTALPRFISLQSDARISALVGLQGGMQSAVDMIHPLAIQQGLDRVSQATINIDGDNVLLAWGYPAADSANTWSRLIVSTFSDAIFDPDVPAEWYFHNNPANNWIRFMTRSMIDPSHHCFLRYTEATSSAPPSFELTDTGC